jgi:acyl CoA:acetate/3-ketoacid CoA transferase beta subunit
MNENYYSPDEIMVVCMSRQIEDNELVVQGIATPLVAAAFLLARQTHAPSLYFASAIGQGICKHPAPLGVSTVESLWIDRSIKNIGFGRTAAEFLPSLKPKEFFRPAQICSNGDFNNIAFGKSYKTPKLRLPGSGGIPDVTTYINKVFLYVPRHSKVTFVPKLDFHSGLGHQNTSDHRTGPRYLVSNLGQFDFYEAKMRLITYHKGTTVKKIQSKTGFPLIISEQVHETPPPTAVELDLLRNEIDPLGIRNLELLNGPSRKELLRKILEQEKFPGSIPNS